ncbi:RES family NAD+ phosphorylase [Pantoea allii]|uniref:RES family NAD+ phosphorylase n=1 Tax=Pantoea allii TaxID=574096 RepID=UPI0024B86597|nr:RES family NAD+ phosphorylase [Pantoea allii]MDJ0090495.1 RES family NAD+ phosphorylase [Pantoea allii]
MDADAFLPLSGQFYRSVLSTNAHAALAAPGPQSAGRYHRQGQPALYMSPIPEWSIMAVSGYMREDGLARVLIPLCVSGARVIDQRDKAGCLQMGIIPEASNSPWRAALKQGLMPLSWENADKARASGAHGIIDCSRIIPGGWHLCLFRWNTHDAPCVEVCGEPVTITLSSDGPEWGL